MVLRHGLAKNYKQALGGRKLQGDIGIPIAIGAPHGRIRHGSFLRIEDFRLLARHTKCGVCRYWLSHLISDEIGIGLIDSTVQVKQSSAMNIV